MATTNSASDRYKVCPANTPSAPGASDRTTRGSFTCCHPMAVPLESTATTTSSSGASCGSRSRTRPDSDGRRATIWREVSANTDPEAEGEAGDLPLKPIVTSVVARDPDIDANGGTAESDAAVSDPRGCWPPVDWAAS